MSKHASRAQGRRAPFCRLPAEWFRPRNTMMRFAIDAPGGSLPASMFDPAPLPPESELGMAYATLRSLATAVASILTILALASIPIISSVTNTPAGGASLTST